LDHLHNVFLNDTKKRKEVRKKKKKKKKKMMMMMKEEEKVGKLMSGEVAKVEPFSG